MQSLPYGANLNSANLKHTGLKKPIDKISMQGIFYDIWW
jgi:hypothetical protein